MRTSYSLPWSILVGSLSACFLIGLARADEADDAEESAPGLVSLVRTREWRDAQRRDARKRPSSPTGDASEVIRVVTKPDFALAEGAVHPRLPVGPFEIVYEGTLEIREPESIRLGAFLRGELELRLGDDWSWTARGERPTDWVGADQPLRVEPGAHSLRIVFRSLEDGPARLQLWWEGDSFSREPIPATRYRHRRTTERAAVQREALLERGRVAAEQHGCARCHARQLGPIAESATAIQPGPALRDLAGKIQRDWFLAWLDDPSRHRASARMPALFAEDRAGFVERFVLADHFLGHAPARDPEQAAEPKKVEEGGKRFVSIGCAACHSLNEDSEGENGEGPTAAAGFGNRVRLAGLAGRATRESLARFLLEPPTRYVDGRMPKFSLSEEDAGELAAFLLVAAGPNTKPLTAPEHRPPVGARTQSGDGQPRPETEPLAPPNEEELQALRDRLSATTTADAARRLIEEKGCAQCHAGVGDAAPRSLEIDLSRSERWSEQGCLSGKSGPRYSLPDETRAAIVAWIGVAASEQHDSPTTRRRRHLEQRRCTQCHQRDHSTSPPIEQIAVEASVKSKQLVYQRVPALTGASAKYASHHLRSVIENGVAGLRPKWYSYRMPAFGADADDIVRALAEADGEWDDDAIRPPLAGADDPNLHNFGQLLVGYQGYSCVSCHVWKGETLTVVEPSSAGPELTSVTRRIRREWFDRWLENPLRIHPTTPMPAIFRKGQPAALRNVLNGDVQKQREALWSYLARGTEAPDPPQKLPLAIAVPDAGTAPLVAQIPLQLPDGKLIESIVILNEHHDASVYDVERNVLVNHYSAAALLRKDGTQRGYRLMGTPLSKESLAVPSPLQLESRGKVESPTNWLFRGYDRAADGARVRSTVVFAAGSIELTETVRPRADDDRLVREWVVQGVPAGWNVQVRTHLGKLATGKDQLSPVARVNEGRLVSQARDEQTQTLRLAPTAPATRVAVSWSHRIEAPRQPVLPDPPPLSEGPGDELFERDTTLLERPGFRAVRYPRPKLTGGEDRVMPFALATDPSTARLYVASAKLGELFYLDDPHDDGRDARFVEYTRGLFQDVFGMEHDGRSLLVVHRRNVTRLLDTDGDGIADRFDRVAPIAQGIGETYDWAYGGVRDRGGHLVISLAPHANAEQPGAGAAQRLSSDNDGTWEEIAFGLRNPVGWCRGPDGELFFTDNQGNWVATNKLSHLQEGKFFGFVNAKQAEHQRREMPPTALWVPYGWAQSINGVAYDASGKFGPFGEQFFLAELMRGGAIVRASLERVNGVYQGVCFPFWGRGLMGPLSLCFDSRSRLYVGSVTEPGWMAQPDRGGLFRIDYTGEMPFEMRTIRARPRGFRVEFTLPVDASTAGPNDFSIEHHRYEYSSQYGSPELDRRRLAIHNVRLSDDGLAAELETEPLERGRVYSIQAGGPRATTGERLVHPLGVYTLNEIPGR